MYFSVKPLYAAQRQFEYQRHKKRLQSINSDKPRLSLINNKYNQFSKMRQRSCQIKIQQQLQKQNSQNNKLLNKLLQISSKKSASFQTHITNQYISNKMFNNNNGINNKRNSKQQSQSMYNMNPFRKKTMRQIQIQNSILGSRLLHKKSQFTDINSNKNINQYVKIKKNLKKNRQIKLQPFSHYQHHQYSKTQKSYSISHHHNTINNTHNNTHNENNNNQQQQNNYISNLKYDTNKISNSCQHCSNQISKLSPQQQYQQQYLDYQQLKYLKMKTQPTHHNHLQSIPFQ